MKIIPCIQNTPEWLAIRSRCDTASEAPAMMGVSKYLSRNDLMQQKQTGLVPEVNEAKQSLFDQGHAAEASARPIAEEIIGEELSPTTGITQIAGLELLASFDGITFLGDLIFEHKLWNAALAESVKAGTLPLMYTAQMDHQLLVSGAKKCLFMVSDGTKEKCAWMWYEPKAEALDAIVAGWLQFHKDLAVYQPPEATDKPKIEAVEAFPTPSIQVRGELVACNLDAITPYFDKFLAETPTILKTDEDFAQGEVNAKASRNAAKSLKLTAKAVIDQIMPISSAVRELENYAAKFDALGLCLEKAVKDQKDSIKIAAISKARLEFQMYVNDLDAEINPIRLEYAPPDFAGSIKGLKTTSSLHNVLATELANSKIAVDAIAKAVRGKMSWFASKKEFEFLFHDMQSIIYKQEDDFKMLVGSRIKEHLDREAVKRATPTPTKGTCVSAPVDVALTGAQAEIDEFLATQAIDNNKKAMVREVIMQFLTWRYSRGWMKAA